MKLINRYIRREIISTFALVLLVLIAILLVQRLAFYLNQVINGSLSQSAVFSLLGLQIVRFVTELLPLSFLLASILAFGRLYKDSEMTALYALSMPVKRLYRILLQIGIPLSLFLLILNFWIVPEIAQIQDVVLKKAREDAQLTILKPGVFQKFANGKHTIYVQSIDTENGALRNIFIKSNTDKKDDFALLTAEKSEETKKNNEYVVTLAQRGTQEIDENNVRFIILEQGSRTTYLEEYAEVTYFETLRLRIDVDNSNSWPSAISWSLGTLLQIDNPYVTRELQRRLSGPISIFLLILIIPALSHSKPRQGRFNKLILGVIFYVFYFNFIGMGLAWITSGKIPASIGIWWVHIVMFIFAFYIYRRYNRSL